MKNTYPNTLDNVVSECIWLRGSISKTLGGVREQTNKLTEATTLYTVYIYIYIYVCVYISIHIYYIYIYIYIYIA